MDYKRIFITVNAETGVIVDSTFSTLKDAFLPYLYCGETVIFCISFVDSDGEAYPLNESDIFDLSVDKDFIHEVGGEDDPLMAYSDSDMVDIAGDWDEIDRAAGQISIRVDCNTEGFRLKIGSSENVSAYIEVDKYVSGSASPSVLLRNKIITKNVIKTTEGAPASSDPEYYSAIQMDALLDAKADKAPDVQATITDNATTNIVLGAVATYRAFKIEYTLDDGTRFRKGTLNIIHDGTNAYINEDHIETAEIAGITFDADISDGNTRLLAIASAVGSDLKMVYQIISKIIISA